MSLLATVVIRKIQDDSRRVKHWVVLLNPPFLLLSEWCVHWLSCTLVVFPEVCVAKQTGHFWQKMEMEPFQVEDHLQSPLFVWVSRSKKIAFGCYKTCILFPTKKEQK